MAKNSHFSAQLPQENRIAAGQGDLVAPRGTFWGI